MVQVIWFVSKHIKVCWIINIRFNWVIITVIELIRFLFRNYRSTRSPQNVVIFYVAFDRFHRDQSSGQLTLGSTTPRI